MRVWVNGESFDDPTRATVAATDHGLVVGDGVFEVIKVTERRPFAVRRHLERLSRSAAALGLPDPDHAVVREAIDTVLDGWTERLGRLRVTYTGGLGPLGSAAPYGPPTLVVAVEALSAPAAVGTLVTVPWTRNERGALTGVKSVSYAENVRALAYGTQCGASEAIFVNTAGNVCEGTGTNIFCVFGTDVVTPPLSAGPLRGVTRDLILEWCSVTEADLTLVEALGADEVFVTSTLRDVQAVSAWDDTEFVAPGPRTQEFVSVYACRSADQIDP
jgi:branched-chain amino acid aminotransferase